MLSEALKTLISDNLLTTFKETVEFINTNIKNISDEEYHSFAQMFLEIVAGRAFNKKFKEADIK